MPSPTDTPLIEVTGLVKHYGAIQALGGVDVTFRRGEIHGLVGANGAGKSTLVRTLAGLEAPDEGEIRIDGSPAVISSPAAAARLGFAFIHQELNLVDRFTAAQNLLLGSLNREHRLIGNFSSIPAGAHSAAAQVGIDFPLDRVVGELTTHQKWLVSIARALLNDSRLIVMDEPTGSLDAEEADRILQVCRHLAADGVAVGFISHRLDEVTGICDRVTVFRDGTVSASLEGEEITRERLIVGIVGREVTPGSGRSGADLRDAPIALEVRGIVRGRSVNGASLRLHEGEMLGIAGLVGAGRTELARIIFGADRPDGGEMLLFGSPYAPRDIRAAKKARIAYVPEERRAEALFLRGSLTTNLYAASWAERATPGTGLISQRRADRAAEEVSAGLGVVMRAGGARQPIQALSGGNQQKVVIGRWLQTEPRVLILDEPTRGVDIGARADIYARIRDIVRTGMSVIVISSEFEELLECDRVAVMAGGAIIGELAGDDVTVPDMLALCYS